MAVTADALLAELDPVAGQLLDRHLLATREWFPHEHVPYSRGRDFEAGGRWCESDTDLGGIDVPPAVRSAFFVNLLTEDNLPYYTNDVFRMFGTESAFGEWGRRWTAEEARHSIAIRDYVTVTRLLDPWDLERARLTQMWGGETPHPPSPYHGLVYLTLQELATRISHRNAGKHIVDPAGYEVMARIAYDENLHHLFYRDLASAAIEIDPSSMVIAMDEVVRGFEMPGTGIPDFATHAAAIARAGIYDLAIHHDQILEPVVLRHWKVAELEGLTPAAEAARASLLDRIERTGRLGRRLAARRGPVAASA